MKAIASVIFVIGLCASAAFAQTPAEKLDWLKKNAHDLRSVVGTKDDDYSDLFWLDGALKGVRVVALGEASHGDGTSLQMKARLVRYLHERLGFDILAWESNIFDVRTMDTAFRDPAQTPLAAARSGVFGVWAGPRQLLPFWDYIRETQSSGRPLEMAGFDVRFSGSGEGSGRAALMRYLRDFFGKAGKTKGDESRWDRFEKAVAAQVEPAGQAVYDNPLYDEQFLQALLTRVDTARGEFRAVWSEREIGFARRQLINIGYLERYLREEFGGKRPPAFTRDTAMGLNLRWLVENRYPDRKIIVWAATAHIQNDSEPNDSAFSAVKRALGAKAYSLVFLSSEGSNGFVHEPREPKDSLASVPEPGPGSLAAMCRDTGRSLFFLDFTALPADHWLRQPIEASFRQHGRIFSSPQEMIRVWPQRHDGMIYIRRMEPCISLPKPDSARARQ